MSPAIFRAAAEWPQTCSQRAQKGRFVVADSPCCHLKQAGSAAWGPLMAVACLEGPAPRGSSLHGQAGQVTGAASPSPAGRAPPLFRAMGALGLPSGAPFPG